MNIKRITSVIASMAAMSCMWSSSVCAKADTKTLTLGDVNGDTLVNAVDASEVLSEYARTSTGSAPLFSDDQIKCGDVDKNGTLNAVDASHILSYYAYRSTGGTLTFEEYLDSQTTQKPTEPPTTQPPAPVHEYVIENIAHDPYVFKDYARKLKGELYQFRKYYSQYGDTTGAAESELLLAILNYGQIDERVLQEILGGYSAEEMVDYGNFLYNIAQMKKDYGANVDFTKYTLNRTIGEYMNSLSNAADNGNLTDMIRNAWENDDMPEDCLNHPAPYIALASYDEVYDNEQILNSRDANAYIVSEKVDEIISKCLGRSFTR